MTRTTATFLLLIAAFFWGMAFIAQKSAMDAMGPLTFISARYLIGGTLVLPLAWREARKVRHSLSPRQWAFVGLLILSFFLGSWLQQWGLETTSVTNGGFLTGLYVFFVPLIQLVLFRTRPHPVVWLCAPLALAGLFLLSGASVTPFVIGDYLIVASAAFWAIQVYLLGKLAGETAMPLFISTICFLAAGTMAGLTGLALEHPDPVQLQAGWVEIAYAGIFSTAIGFSLQAKGQQYVPPANAAIIMSGETLFAAAGGAIILGERLTPLGYVGVALLFCAIVAVETVPALKKKPTQAA